MGYRANGQRALQFRQWATNVLKALRGVAIIISANGAEKPNYDMVEMLKRKIDNKAPADYLSEKLDELLIDLEK